MRRPEVYTVDPEVEPDLYKTGWVKPGFSEKVVDISALCPKLRMDGRALLSYYKGKGGRTVQIIDRMKDGGGLYAEVGYEYIGEIKLAETHALKSAARQWGLDPPVLAALVTIYAPSAQ